MTKKQEKGTTKVAISTKFEGFPVSRFFGGVIFQNGFSPKAVPPEAPGVRRDPMTHLGARGLIWRYLVMK